MLVSFAPVCGDDAGGGAGARRGGTVDHLAEVEEEAGDEDRGEAGWWDSCDEYVVDGSEERRGESVQECVVVKDRAVDALYDGRKSA